MKLLIHITLMLLLLSCAFACQEEGSIVVRVDGAGIVRNEIEFALAPFRAMIAGLREDRTAADAEPSVRAIVDSAIARSVGIKIEQVLAADAGIISDPGYTLFRKTWMEEDDSRRKAKAKGEIVYGPVEFTESAFYDFHISNIVTRLKSDLAEKHFDVTSTRIEAWYVANRTELFRLPDAMSFMRVVAGKSDRENLDALRVDVVNGVSLESLRLRHRCMVDTVTAIDWKRLNESEERSPTIGAAGSLHSGEVSPWMPEEGKMVLMKCLSRQPAGFMPLTEVKSSVRARIIDEEYASMLGDRRARAIVSVDSAAYRAILDDLLGRKR